MTTFIEYSTSAGHGTLVEHGVKQLDSFDSMIDRRVTYGGVVLASEWGISPERYSEFISIHGGERAV